jgi:hypothetical protein
MPSIRGKRGITVVVAFKGAEYLGRMKNCLRSLVRQTMMPTEIIVSEQDPDGLAASICEEVGATHIVTAARPIFNKSACLNAGIRQSSTAHVYLLDADVVLAPTALESVFHKVGRGNFVMLDARRVSPRDEAGWDDLYPHSWAVDWSRTCFGLMNATTRKNWFRIRGYDERFSGWGFEDTYAVWKAEFFKLSTGWVPGVGVHQDHDRAPGYGGNYEKNKELYERRTKSRVPSRWGEDRILASAVRTPKALTLGEVLPSSPYVVVSLAAFPSRQANLADLVRSLLPQVHRLNIFLSNFDSVPDFWDTSKIVFARSQEVGDLGEYGKYWWADTPAEIHLFLDDWTVYPPDHVQKEMEKQGKTYEW